MVMNAIKALLTLSPALFILSNINKKRIPHFGGIPGTFVFSGY